MAHSPFEGFDPDDPRGTYTALPESRATRSFRDMMANPHMASFVPMLARTLASDKFEASALARRQMEQCFFQLLAERRIGDLLDFHIASNVKEIRDAFDIALRITHLFPGQPKLPHECEESKMARIMMNLRKHFESMVFKCMSWVLDQQGLLTLANLCHFHAENSERDEAEGLRLEIEFSGA